jgi:hypothetical protein
MKALPVLFIILLSVVCITSSLAQWNAANDLAVCTKDGTQLGAWVLSDHHGGVWVIWAHRVPHRFDVPDSNRFGIQHLDSNGYALLGTNGIILNDTLNTTTCLGAYTTSDGSLTVAYFGWDSARKVKHYIQRFSPNGTRAWGYDGKRATAIAADTLTHKATPRALVPLPNDRAYLSLLYNGETSKKMGYIQYVDADGSYLWGDTGRWVFEGWTVDPGSGALFPRDEGGVFIAYKRLVDSTLQISGVDSLGSLLYAEDEVVSIQDPRRDLLSNNITITSRRDHPDSSGMMIYATISVFSSGEFRDELRLHLYNAEGDRSTPEEGRLLSDTNTALIYHVLPQSDGSAVYTYMTSSDVLTPLYARCVSLTGADCWDQPVVLGGADSSRTRMILSQDASGIVLTWDEGDSGKAIFAQMLNPASGAMLWGNTPLSVGSQQVNTRSYAVHDRDPEGNCIVCWTDLRNIASTKEDIYCTKITTTGLFVTVLDKSVSEPRHAIQNVQNFPNPAARSIILNVESGADDIVSVTVYDPLGSEVYHRTGLVCRTGETQLSIVFGNIPSGTYHYRIHGRTIDTAGQFIVAR